MSKIKLSLGLMALLLANACAVKVKGGQPIVMGDPIVTPEDNGDNADPADPAKPDSVTQSLVGSWTAANAEYTSVTSGLTQKLNCSVDLEIKKQDQQMDLNLFFDCGDVTMSEEHVYTVSQNADLVEGHSLFEQGTKVGWISTDFNTLHVDLNADGQYGYSLDLIQANEKVKLNKYDFFMGENGSKLAAVELSKK